MTVMHWRDLAANEQALLNRLLTPTFSGKDQLRVQLKHCRVRTIDDNGSLEFEVNTDTRIPDAKYGVLTEGEFRDFDQGAAHVLLHVRDGLVRILEFYKEDSSNVLNMPQPENVDVFA